MKIRKLLEDELNELTELDLEEAVQRQFKRIGDKFKRAYRCTSGARKGRVVSDPTMCGQRKDPRKVRQGKKSARLKKAQRVRKSIFTKRNKTAHKRLVRMNRVLRNDV